VIDKGHIYPPESQPITVRYSGSPTGNDAVYSGMVSVDQLRLQRLVKYRMWFTALSLLALAALIISLIAGISYEPFAALLSCLLGTLVVFAMKIRDAHK
jgi:hypothetical protein